MRQLLPEYVEEIDTIATYEGDARPAPPGRPWLLTNMIASSDGAISVEGRSGALGTDADKVVFSTLRSLADVVLVGAGTARTEGYGPPRTPRAAQARRRARGQTPYPRLALVSGRVDLDFTAPLFADAAERPLIITSEAAPRERVAAAAEVADVITSGDPLIDLPAALGQLRERGVEIVTCEGGPSLNGSLLSDGLIDELCLSLTPAFVGGTSPRAVGGGTEDLRPLRLERVLEEGGVLFLRYTVLRDAA